MTLPDPELQPEFYEHVAPKRAVALVLDMIATAALALPLIIFIGAAVSLAFERFEVGGWFMILNYMAMSVAYRTVMLSRQGATFGMMVAVLKWRRMDGRPTDPMLALRYSLMHVVQWAILPLQIVSIVMILVTPYRQGLHDHLLGTTMLHRFAPE